MKNEFSNLEWMYIYTLVGNTSFEEFHEKFSRYIPKDTMDQFRNNNTATKVYDKIYNMVWKGY